MQQIILSKRKLILIISIISIGFLAFGTVGFLIGNQKKETISKPINASEIIANKIPTPTQSNTMVEDIVPTSARIKSNNSKGYPTLRVDNPTPYSFSYPSNFWVLNLDSANGRGVIIYKDTKTTEDGRVDIGVYDKNKLELKDAKDEYNVNQDFDAFAYKYSISGCHDEGHFKNNLTKTTINGMQAYKVSGKANCSMDIGSDYFVRMSYFTIKFNDNYYASISSKSSKLNSEEFDKLAEFIANNIEIYH